MMAGNIKQVAVVDASWMLSYLMPDEIEPQVDISFNLYNSEILEMVSTTLLAWEVINTLNSALKRKRIDKNLANLLSQEFGRLMVVTLPLKDTDTIHLLNLADKYDLSVYDAGYLFLAREHRLPLLTKDQRLAEAAKQELPDFSLSKILKNENLVHDKGDEDYRAR